MTWSLPFFMLLNEKIEFPHPWMCDEYGILAQGGDLSVPRLLCAYQYGIFPWYCSGEPIMWWSPDPRFVLVPDRVKVSKSMRSFMRNHKYTISIDEDFLQVISSCKTVAREGQESTWITDEMKDAYMRLYEQGYAHSIEVREGEELVGGLYGVSLGKVFYGESMFSLKPNTSKLALITLCKFLEARDFLLIDCQVPNSHLISMGGEYMSKEVFLRVMRLNVFYKTMRGSWSNEAMDFQS